MNGVSIRDACLDDLDEIMRLVAACIAGMRSLGIEQWDAIYPDRATIERDLSSQSAWVATVEDAIVGYVVLNDYQDPEYGEVTWTFAAPAAVVHRLMVAPEGQGRGIARALMHTAEARAATLGYASIRLDAFRENPRALHLYDRDGYRRAGEVRLRKGLFICFEKAIPHESRRGAGVTPPSQGTLQAGHQALTVLFLLNAVMFVVEVVAGWRAESMGLIADGLDMGADAAVYLLALLAIGASERRKLSAARFAGRVQLLLAVVAFAEIGRRALLGSAPEPPTMIGVSIAALLVNVACLIVLRRYRDGEVHLQAAWIFSATDVQANLGVLTAGVLVGLLDSAIPDLVIGVVVCGLVLRGALRIRQRVRVAAG